MTGPWLRRGLAAAALATPFALHAAIATGRLAGPAAALAAAQAAGLAAYALRTRRGWQRWAGCGLAALLLLALAARLLRPALGDVGMMAVSGVSHAIINGSLLLLFARSLRPGRTALVTSMATRLRGPLAPAMQTYTRTVTKTWCCFFTGQLLLSALLLTFASHAAWSLFVNVLDLPLVATMFAAEYTVRMVRFHGERHSSPAAIFRSFAERPDGG